MGVKTNDLYYTYSLLLRLAYVHRPKDNTDNIALDFVVGLSDHLTRAKTLTPDRTRAPTRVGTFFLSFMLLYVHGGEMAY